MATKKQRQAVKRKARQYVIIERRYGRQIGRLLSALMSAWLPRIMAAVEPKMRTDALWDELAPLFSAMAADWADKVQRFTTEITTVGADVADVSQLDAAIVRQTLINITLEPSVFRLVQNFAAENASLITNVGQDLIDAAQVLAVNAIEFGDTPDQLTKKIAKVSDQFAGYRARLIARDQVGKLQGQIHMTRMEDAGLKRYEWMTVGDERVRSSHKALDGDIRTWEQSPKPGQEIQCRCQPVVIAEDIL